MSDGELLQPLPCHESAWDATDPDTWALRLLNTQGPPTAPRGLPVNLTEIGHIHLTVASVSAHIRSGIAPGLEVGNFARLILAVAGYFNFHSFLSMATNPLSQKMMISPDWEDEMRGAGLSFLEALQPQPSRDSAGAPLRASLECHLLLASTLLCLPRSAILRYAASHALRPEEPESQSQVRHWMQRANGRTARLALWYAGNLLGLVRERSFKGIHELMGAYISSIAIWTYGKISASAEPAPDGFARGGEVMQAAIPLRLDLRDETPELAAWLDGQPNVYGNLKDVGNISTPGAPNRVLIVASQILDGHGWGVCYGLASFLSSLSTDTEST
jgi:hypothetical protein